MAIRVFTFIMIADPLPLYVNKGREGITHREAVVGWLVRCLETPCELSPKEKTKEWRDRALSLDSSELAR